MNRRSFLASALVAPLALGAEPDDRPLQCLLLGDSEAYLLARPFRAEARKRRVTVAVDALGGSSTRQWRKHGWFKRSLEKHSTRVVAISLGVNCTRVERPVLARDAGELVLIANDMGVAPVWLLPPPLRMDTRYLVEAVAATEVFAFSPGPLPLESDGVHATPRGFEIWAGKIAETLWE